MQFKDVIGQEQVKAYLRECVEEQRIPHALLFSGEEGHGALPLALAFAQYMGCSHRANGDSCGKCSHCKKMERYIHVDLRMYVPSFKQGSSGVDEETLPRFIEFLSEQPYFTETQWYEQINAEVRTQGSIFVETCEAIIESLWYRSYELPFKIVLMWLPERMVIPAANRLLKVVEEPPTETYFFFVTENEKAVLPTIRSRCQRIFVPPVDFDSLMSFLMQKRGLPEETALQLARAANGSVTEALLLEDTGGLPSFLDLMKELYRCALGLRYDQAFEWVSQVSSYTREQQKALLRYLSQMLREIYIHNLSLPQVSYLVGQELLFAQQAAPFINGRNVGYLLNEYNQALIEITRNGNARIILTDFVLQHFRCMSTQKG